MRRLLNRVVNIAGLGATVAAALGLVAWLVGRIVSDRYEWSQWIAWIPTPAAIGCALIGFIGAWRPGGGKRRKRIRRIAWGAAVVIIAIDLALFEHHLVSFRRCDTPGLRIVHWNSTNIEQDDQLQAAQFVGNLGADVVILTNPSRIHRLEPIRGMLPEGGRSLRPGPFAVLSGLPVLEARQAIGSDQIHVVVLRLDATEQLGRELTMWLIDLPSDPDQPRMTTAEQVRQWIDEANLPPADIIAGDFNMTRGSAALKTIAPDFLHAFDVAGVGYGATYPRELPWLHIDHMLVGETVEAVSYCVLDPGMGSHRLQVMTVAAALAD